MHVMLFTTEQYKNVLQQLFALQKHLHSGGEVRIAGGSEWKEAKADYVFYIIAQGVKWKDL